MLQKKHDNQNNKYFTWKHNDTKRTVQSVKSKLSFGTISIVNVVGSSSSNSSSNFLL